MDVIPTTEVSMDIIENVVPETVEATPEILRRAIIDGGFGEVTVRSLRTGDHVTVKLTVRKAKPEGGYVSRATRAGRVSFEEGDIIEARDAALDFEDSYIGRFYKASGEWRAVRSADRARAWAAEKVIVSALSGVEVPGAEVFLAARCSCCSRKLTHPESVEEMVGPECSGRRREGRATRRQGVAA